MAIVDYPADREPWRVALWAMRARTQTVVLLTQMGVQEERRLAQLELDRRARLEADDG